MTLKRIAENCKKCKKDWPVKKVKKVVDMVIPTPIGDVPMIHTECPKCGEHTNPVFED